jgi:hypothetical protein
MAVEAHAEEERVHGMDLDGGRAGGVDLDGRRAGGMDLNGGGGRCSAAWRQSARRRGGAVSEAPAWRRSARHRGGRGEGAGADGCVPRK